VVNGRDEYCIRLLERHGVVQRIEKMAVEVGGEPARST
jgi:hypothetical protein